MPDAPDRDQKTEDPTPKRRQEAAKKGDLLQSRELGAAMVVSAGAVWMLAAGPLFVGSIEEMLADGLSFEAADLRDFRPGDTAIRLLATVLMPLFILFAMTLIAAVLTPAMLGSLGFRAGAFSPKPGKLNPMAGLKRMFGLQGLVELVKSLAKVLLLGGVGYWVLSDRFGTLMGLSSAEIRPAVSAFGSSLGIAVVLLSVALALIAMFDVPSQLLQRLGRLRMSKQEVKDESKQTEGSPDLKAAVRRRQHEVLRGSARTAVQEATVILTNPTHFAVALRYRPGMDAAPVVVARGRGDTALAIRELAQDKQVPVLGYPQLTRAIYYTTRTGDPIREDLYLAVASVLSFVFQLDAIVAQGGAQPAVEVPPEARFDEDGTPQT